MFIEMTLKQPTIYKKLPQKFKEKKNLKKIAYIL